MLYSKVTRDDMAAAWRDGFEANLDPAAIDGEEKGVLEGRDFNPALLAIWPGDVPVTSSLKEGLLGVDNQKMAFRYTQGGACNLQRT